MAHNFKTYPTPQGVADAFAQRLLQLNHDAQQAGTAVTVCLSGGSTPKLLFKTLAASHSEVDWSSVHFFWGDERCVPAASEESNFGEADRLFLSAAKIPADNVHPVDGTIDPELAAQQYAAEITRFVPAAAGQVLPCFDLMVLGMGDDGHTASIFPDSMPLLDSSQTCEVASHPVSGQKRVTVTGPIIKAAQEICFLVTGQNKADVLASIKNQTEGYETYPTTRFASLTQATFWLDQAAASGV